MLKTNSRRTLELSEAEEKESRIKRRRQERYLRKKADREKENAGK